MKYSKRDFEIILKENGYHLARVKGGHFIYRRDGTPKNISINKAMNRMIAERLIKENNLKVEDYE